MQGENTLPPSSMWRRCAGAVAFFCYLFAATLGALVHSQAMTLIVAPTGMDLSVPADRGGHDHAPAQDHALAQDHASGHERAAGHGDHAPAPKVKTPCDQSCILCQSCSPSALLIAPMHSGDMVSFAYAVRYAMPRAPLPTGHIGALPSEPPRA